MKNLFAKRKFIYEAPTAFLALVLVSMTQGCKTTNQGNSYMPATQHQLSSVAKQNGSLNQDRMSDRPQGELYCAQWDRAGSPQEIAISLNPGHLWGNQFEIFFVASDHSRMHKGRVCSEYEHEYPYALVEVKSSSNLLPPASRNEWILGVAFTTKEMRFDPSRPMRIESDPCVGTGAYNVLCVEPVQWDDWPKDFGLAPRRLGMDDYKIQYRWAERTMVNVALEN